MADAEALAGLSALSELLAAALPEAEAKPKPTHYKVVSISLYQEDIVRLESLVAELKRRGHTKASRSSVLRAAMQQIDLDKVPRGA